MEEDQARINIIRIKLLDKFNTWNFLNMIECIRYVKMCNPDVGEFLVDKFHDKIVGGCSGIRMRNTMLYEHFNGDNNNMMLWDHSVVPITYNPEIIFFDMQIKKEMISAVGEIFKDLLLQDSEEYDTEPWRVYESDDQSDTLEM
jgi:hypothetical protein